MLAERTERTEGTYLLEQRLRYTYDSPARDLRHRLVVVPPVVHGRQLRSDYGFTVSGDAVLVQTTTDAFGNHVVDIRAAVVRSWIEFEAWSLVEGSSITGEAPVAASLLHDRRLRDPSPLTRADGELGDAAREFAGARSGIGLAERICTWTHGALTYGFGSTDVHTTAAAAFRGGRGVCQDYAHVMLALCRAAGLAARYVSGHLEGEGGSHAWVEVIVEHDLERRAPRSSAVAFDPTHDRRAARGYLTVAVGRDYADVAPTSGTFKGQCPGVLTSEKRLRAMPAVA